MDISIEDSPNATARNVAETNYTQRLAYAHQSLLSARRRRSRALYFLVGCTVALILAVMWDGHFQISLLAVLPAVGIAFCIRESVKHSNEIVQSSHRCSFYESSLARLQRDWTAMAQTGEEYARPGHQYQFDFHILGDRSLFSLLCTTRSQAGASRLADYLLDPVSLEEVHARQEAVQELRDQTMLREKIALLGKYQFQGCDAETLRRWMNTPVLRTSRAFPVALLLTGSGILFLVIACLLHLLGWLHALPYLLIVICVQALLCASLFQAVRLRLEMLRSIASECSVLEQGLQLLESQAFHSPKLKNLVEKVRSSRPSLHILRLERLLGWIENRNKEFLYQLSIATAAGTQLVLAIERWRGRHQEQLREWIDIWAEFEALNAIACYTWENPHDTFPEVSGRETFLRMQGAGHPLLPTNKCIRNDVELNQSERFWILSGSNMAGKSTLLRTIGMNAVLAYAGAPVRASQAHISHFTLGASISLSDSLLDGKSKFLAEAERLQGILQQTGAGRPVLFLIDEILSGTNSHDRRMACEHIVKALIAGGAMGILSTHDLALTEIARAAGSNGTNRCMESTDPDQPLKFDYVVKSGVTHNSSATAILKLLGIPVTSG